MATDLKSYPVSWEGQLVLACRKCQKKLKRDWDMRALAKLKKTVKRYNTECPDRQLHVMNVSCMDMCPKDGVTVCLPEHDSSQLSILRSTEDLWQLSNAD